jgi:hypothetical protein
MSEQSAVEHPARDHAEKDMKIGSVLLASALLLGLDPTWADVIRHPIPNSNFPIAQSVEVSGDTTTYYISGQVPPLVPRLTASELSSRSQRSDAAGWQVGGIFA